MEQSKLQTLVNMLLQSDCKELYVEGEFEKIKIVRSYNDSKPKSQVTIAKNEVKEGPKVNLIEIKSSLVGVFHFYNNYSKGDKIIVGEKIGYVESLTTKNDIVSDFSGNVVDMIGEGEAVEYGQVILTLK